MKKVLLFMFILSLNCFSLNIPENIDNQIQVWIKETYPTTSPIDNIGLSAEKIMYNKEIQSYTWLMDNVKSLEDKNVYEKVVNLYNPNQYGYLLVKIMYDREKKNLNC